MGRRSSQKKSAVLLDSDDNDSVSSSSTVRDDLVSVSGGEEVIVDKEAVLDQCLDALYEKRGSTREKALAMLIEAFNSNLLHEFVEKKCATLLHQCLGCLKRGSAKEVAMAAHLIGLLALTTGPGDKAHEILEDSLAPISESLKSRSEISKMSSLLECLAIITFVGAEEPEQTEKAMQVMWQVAHPKNGPNVSSAKPSPVVISTVVSAWAFLLTTVEGWTLNSKSWQEGFLTVCNDARSIAYFSSLLEKDDRSVRMGAGEALALIFEVGNLEKFSEGSSGSSKGEDESSRGLIHIQGLKSKILNQVKGLSSEAGGKGAANKKDLTSQKNTFRDVLDFLEFGYSPETTTKVGGESLNTSSWAQLIQLNFMKRFLGGGFVKHMQENEFLHDVFGFKPKKSLSLSASEKRIFRSPNSGLSKARTQLLNKQRAMSQGKNAGQFAAVSEDGMD